MTSLDLLDNGWSVIFPPSLTTRAQLPVAPCALRIDCSADGTVVRRFPQHLSRPPGGWNVAMCTSGTTGRPRIFGFSTEQLNSVTTHYRRLYRVSQHSLFVTALPSAHNLAFVAGVCTAAAAGASFAHIDAAADLLRSVERWDKMFDRIVILANPVMLEQMLHGARKQRDHVTIDSGGAPLSRTAIAAIRTHVCDIREGYGTTETLSLTHFDEGDDPAAIGTVGKPLGCVSCRLGKSRPTVEVSSPMSGVSLSADLQAGQRPQWIRTGDLGEWTVEGNLRVVGREQDEIIGGLWPRDVLDAIGPVLGYRTALVIQEAQTIRVVTHHSLGADERQSIELLIRERLDEGCAAKITCTTPQHELLYSAKLPRPQTA
ncbi:AMP-binding protein [Paraburkholderia domus]|uniref:AMP-binding protein n=1 Tax=Paraburkholderia domus TaxID=2793075 RepID=UPI001B8B34DF|nr:AMP-binding protein [Paraburkholderia domus]